MISFVGAGIRGYSQITLEGLEALGNAEKILTFYLDNEFFGRFGLQNVESLAKLYLAGARDEENYARILEKIEDDAAKHTNVAVLLPGNPRLGVTIVQRLAHRRDVKVIPGISSFETMYNDLEVDPLERGSVVIDVNRLLLFDLKISPELDHYLYHICSVGEAATHFDDPTKGNAISLLCAKLREGFPESHPVTLIGSSTVEGEAPIRTETRLGLLEKLLPEIRFETSLYVAGLQPKAVNREFLALLRGKEAQ